MDAWHEFLTQVKQARQNLGFRAGEECFFRGVGDRRHELAPSLFRVREHKGRERDILTLEYDLYFEFKARAKELHQQPRTDWELLFEMRHHALPTRILDWTETLGVAIFFALDGYKGESGVPPRIWILNPYALNEFASNDRDLIAPEYLGYRPDTGETWSYERILLQRNPSFGWTCPVAIYPNQKVLRMHSQRGWFTIHGDDPRPLNQILDANGASDVLRFVDIPQGAIPGAREFLEAAGVDHYTLFPDLDGLSRQLHTKYSIRY